MSGLVKCPLCGLHNPAEETRCEACDRSLADAVSVGVDADVVTAPIVEEQELGTKTARDQAGVHCECLFPVSAPAICRTCGYPGAERAEAEAEAAPCRYRLKYGAHASVSVETDLLIGRGYRGVPPDLVNWLSSHAGISRRHCLLTVERHRLSVIDLGSTNGTSVGGVPIRPGLPHKVSTDGFPLRIGLGRFADVVVERLEEPL